MAGANEERNVRRVSDKILQCISEICTLLYIKQGGLFDIVAKQWPSWRIVFIFVYKHCSCASIFTLPWKQEFCALALSNAYLEVIITITTEW